MIQNLTSGILFFKKLFCAYNFLYLSKRSSGHHQSFSSRNSQIQLNKNYPKRSLILQYSFAQITSLILIICSRKKQKAFLTLKFFQKKCFCSLSEKNIVLHHFLTPRNCILEALWKQMSVYFCISLYVRTFCSREVIRFSWCGWVWGRLNNFF